MVPAARAAALAGGMLAAAAGAQTAAPPADATRGAFKQPIPAAAFEFEMVPVPGDAARGIAPFHMSRTEMTWEAFDVFVYGLDRQKSDPNKPADPATGENSDAVTRPSKPYLPPDRGFGHEGYAAICVSFKNASEFCRWLSEKSGRSYRLPTAAEWEHACRAGTTTVYSFGDEPAKLAEYAWFEGNADGTTHPVASKKPNPWGLFDMHGNVAEWVVGPDGKPVTRGGSYRDDPGAVTSAASQPQKSSWNASDPQIPKSSWWLSDGPFVGFRVVCDSAEVPATANDEARDKAPGANGSPGSPAGNQKK